MKKFDINFDGTCTIEAKNEEDAIREFWNLIGTEQALPFNLYYINEIMEGK